MSLAAVMTALAVAIIGGAVSQRICGMGLGLIAVPAFVWLTGPVIGVLTVNIVAFFVGAAVAWSLRCDIIWSKWRVLAISAIIGTIPGWALVHWMPLPLLNLAIGTVLVISLLMSLGRDTSTAKAPRGTLAGVGFIGAILNTAVGQAAPVMVAYQRASNWDQRTFQATLQPTFLVMNAASIVAKGFIDLPAPPLEPLSYVTIVIVATIVGIVAGELAAPHVPVPLAKRLAFAVAAIGAVATLGRGIWGMF